MIISNMLSEFTNVLSGLPHGSVLGPLLFLLYINDLPDVCINARIKMFADDSKIYFKCGSERDRERLFLDVSKVFDWLKQNQLGVAIEKCSVLHLGHSNPRFSYSYDNSILPCVSEMRDIGVLMSNDMKSSLHCSAVVKKASTMVNLFLEHLNVGTGILSDVFSPPISDLLSKIVQLFGALTC